MTVLNKCGLFMFVTKILVFPWNSVAYVDVIL